MIATHETTTKALAHLDYRLNFHDSCKLGSNTTHTPIITLKTPPEFFLYNYSYGASYKYPGPPSRPLLGLAQLSHGLLCGLRDAFNVELFMTEILNDPIYIYICTILPTTIINKELVSKVMQDF